MRYQGSPGRTNNDAEYGENRESAKNRPLNYNEDEYRGSRQESVDEYYRDSLINVEDQVETSKLVLQLVTDSRFNMTQINGQRKLGGPPPGWKGSAPGPGCEVFVGKIPRTLYEHEIYPIFRRMGEVYEIRLMMDFSGTNRGYCFVMFGKPEFAVRAIHELDNFEIRPGRRIGVVASINNCRLYVGQLSPDVTSESVIRKIYDITDDVGQVAVYRNANDQARYALISYKTHRGAAMARRRLVPDRASLFGGGEVSIDWAHPSMFPSNVVEDTGTCDDRGNVEISRLVVGNENKRYQNRRRVRDDFLEHSIRAYLQTDRGLDHNSRNKRNPSSQNQSFNYCVGGVTRGIDSFDVYDRCQRQNSRADKSRGKIEVPGKSRDPNSSFDANPGSAESESSACSSQSSASERHRSLSKEFSEPTPSSFYHSQIFSRLDNEEGAKIEGKMFGNPSGGSGDKKIGKTHPESLNLFDNYTFSVNSRDGENRGDFDEADENNGNDFSPLIFGEDNNSTDNGAGRISHNEEEKYAGVFESGENFLSVMRKHSEVKREGKKTVRENERKSQGRNLLIEENSIAGYSAVRKPARHASRSQDFEDLVSFQKTVGVPVKNEAYKPKSNLANFSRPQNRNGISSLVWDKNSRNSATSLLVAAENCLSQQQISENNCNRTAAYASSKIPNSSNTRSSFSHGMSNDAKRASIFAQLSRNAYDFSYSGLGNASVIQSAVYSDSELAGEREPPQSAQRRAPASGFIPHFSPDQSYQNFNRAGCYQGKKIPIGQNGPKNGRPILSRSYASLCNEN